MILLDTSGLLAALDESQRDHEACAAALARALPPLLLSPFVLAELDYLLGEELGWTEQRALLEEVVKGAYRLEAFDPADVGAALGVLDRYVNLELGLADASIVVLAQKYGSRDLLSLDEGRMTGVARHHDRRPRAPRRKRW